MNWDWDKLQEKRQRQPRSSGGRDFGNGGNDNEPPRRRDTGGPAPDPFKKMREFAPSGGRALWWLAGGLVILWMISGIYIVEPDEEGVVLLFGEYNRSVPPGPHYHIPFPIESVYTPKVTQIQRVEVGFRSTAKSNTFQQGQVRSIQEEASTLTGDENIVSVQFSVQYKIRDAVEYLFRVTNQAAVVRNAAEAAMREIIGTSQIDSALTDGKLKIQGDATELLQRILDRYEVGVHVIAVQLQDVHPPQDVIEAFKDVASAREDKSRIINEAEAYRNELLPKARGQAAEMLNQAQAYKATRVRSAEGETGRFLAVLSEYEKARDVTRKRLYYEAVEDILSSTDIEKILLPTGTADRMLPFLPFDALKNPGRAAGKTGGN